MAETPRRKRDSWWVSISIVAGVLFLAIAGMLILILTSLRDHAAAGVT